MLLFPVIQAHAATPPSFLRVCFVLSLPPSPSAHSPATRMWAEKEAQRSEQVPLLAVRRAIRSLCRRVP